MHRWRYPSLSLHGIEGAFSDGGAKTVIPRKVIGKFSIRLVPDMDPEVVEKQVANQTHNKPCDDPGLSLTCCAMLHVSSFLSRLHSPAHKGTQAYFLRLN